MELWEVAKDIYYEYDFISKCSIDGISYTKKELRNLI